MTNYNFQLGKKYKPIFSIQAEPPNWVDDSDDNIGLESISEPDLERDGTGDDDWSTSPLLCDSGTSPPSLSIASQQQQQQRRDEGDYNSDIIIEDDDDDDDNDIDEHEWVEPSVPPRPSFVSTATHAATSPGVSNRKSLNLNRSKAPPAIQHYPFPSSSSPSDIHEFDPADVVRVDNNAKFKPSSVRNARARDGGRTQSGGIKGIYIDSGDDET